jgi:hypothetical protein
MLNWADFLILLNVSLDPAPTSRASFTTPLLIADVAFDGAAERVRTYTSVGQAQADLTATEISQFVFDAIAAAFSQNPRPQFVKVGRYISGMGGDASYATAYAAVKGVDNSFYGVCIDSRDSSDISAISALIEAEGRGKFFVAQSGVGDLLTTGFPAALSGANNRERTAILYHDDSTLPSDFAYLCNRLVFDPDTQSAPWDASVNAIVNYDVDLTPTQLGFAKTNNVNIVLPYGPAATFVDAGVNTKGRPIYEIVTADWFATRIQEDVASVKVQYSARGEKIVIGPEGQAILRGLVESRFAQGSGGASPHFVDGQTQITFPTITSDDLAAQRIRASVRATLAASGRVFEFNINFTRENIFEPEA